MENLPGLKDAIAVSAALKAVYLQFCKPFPIVFPLIVSSEYDLATEVLLH